MYTKNKSVLLYTQGVKKAETLSRLFFESSSGRTRTYDPAVNSRLLYQLSYRGIFSLVDLCPPQSADSE